MLNLHLVAQQHAGADLHTAVGAAAVGGIKAQLFPQDPFLDVGVFHTIFVDAQNRSDCSTNAVVALLVVGLPFLRFQLLVAALLELARQFHHDFGGAAIAVNQRVHHLAHLVQANVHRGVGNLAVALFVRVLRLTAAKSHVALQGFAVVRQLLESKHGLDFTG